MLYRGFASTINKHCQEREINLVRKWQSEVEYFLDLGDKGWKAGWHFFEIGISNKPQLKLTFLSNNRHPLNIAKKILKHKTNTHPVLDYALSNDIRIHVGMTLKESSIEYELYFSPKESSHKLKLLDQRLEALKSTPTLVGINDSNTLAVYLKEGCDASFINECQSFFDLSTHNEIVSREFFSQYKYEDNNWKKFKNVMEIKTIDTSAIRQLDSVESINFSGLIPTSEVLPYFVYCRADQMTALYFPISALDLM